MAALRVKDKDELTWDAVTRDLIKEYKHEKSGSVSAPLAIYPEVAPSRRTTSVVGKVTLERAF